MQNELMLVTGACGFIGSNMVELLVENGLRVRATDLPGSERGLHHDVIKKLNIEFIPSDLTKKDTLKSALKDVSYVFHPAAVFDYAASWEQLEKVNIHGTQNLLEAMLEEGKIKRFINWSSAGVYGEPDPKYQPTREDAPKGNKCLLYEKSKLLQEQTVEDFYQKYKIPYTTLRPSPVYGPRNFYGIGQTIFYIAKGQVPGIPVTAKGRMPLVHVKDVCQAALFLAQKEEAVGEVYNIADDTNINMYSFAHFVAPTVDTVLINFYLPMGIVANFLTLAGKWSQLVAKIKKTRPKIELESLSYLTHSYWFSNEKIKKLGYQLLYPEARVGLKETIKWYMDNGYLPQIDNPKLS